MHPYYHDVVVQDHGQLQPLQRSMFRTTDSSGATRFIFQDHGQLRCCAAADFRTMDRVKERSSVSLSMVLNCAAAYT